MLTTTHDRAGPLHQATGGLIATLYADVVATASCGTAPEVRLSSGPASVSERCHQANHQRRHTDAIKT